MVEQKRKKGEKEDRRKSAWVGVHNEAVVPQKIDVRTRYHVITTIMRESVIFVSIYATSARFYVFNYDNDE